MSSWRDGPVGSSRPCTGTGRGPSTGWSALRAARQGCSPTGACSMAAAEQWEPDDARVSFPVLRERGGAIPPRHPPRVGLSAWGGWKEALGGAQRQAGALRPVAPRGQDPADRVRAVRRPTAASRRATTPGDLPLPGLHALLRRDQERQVHGQTENAGETHGPETEDPP